jgi:hypothetical protein
MKELFCSQIDRIHSRKSNDNKEVSEVRKVNQKSKAGSVSNDKFCVWIERLAYCHRPGPLLTTAEFLSNRTYTPSTEK